MENEDQAIEFFEELPEELQVHVIRQLGGHLLLAATVSHRLHGIVRQLMLALPFRLDPDEGPLLGGQLTALHWSKANIAQGPPLTLYHSPERGPVVRRSIVLPGGQPGWSFLQSCQQLAAGACLTFSLRVRSCSGRETKIELMGGVILRSSATTEYDPAGTNWSYQMWNVPGKPGGFTLMAPSRIHDSPDAPWHNFAQIVNDDGQVEMYEDGRYCFTADPTPGAEELRIKFDIFQLDYAQMEVDLCNLRYFMPEPDPRGGEGLAQDVQEEAAEEQEEEQESDEDSDEHPGDHSEDYSGDYSDDYSGHYSDEYYSG
mmetsp:Transcript_12583/g.31357  ORF Transcript_12583/g.31357 Transcript_12583/m.31357 type:complete len:315 (+) Transcript_12583:229-1173(+)